MADVMDQPTDKASDKTADKEVHAVIRTRGNSKTIIVRVVIGIVLIGLAVFGYGIWKQMQEVETTDDAQVDGQIYAISSRIAGHVSEVLIEDHQFVKAGDVLARLDPKDYQVALAKAKADLADAMATLASSRTDVPITSVTTSSTLAGAKSSRLDATAAVSGAEQQLGAARARLVTSQANVRVAEANYAKAAQDVARYKMLVDKDEISKQQYDQAIASAEAARATLDAQKAQVAEAQQNISVAEKAIEQARARVSQTEATVESAMTGPQQVKVTEAKVQSAQAKVDQQKALVEQAELNLQYTTIVAPVTGIVGKKNVEVGVNLSPGQQLLAIVPLDGIWITANFKETQLRRMKVGQPVTIKVDAYDREYHGKVLRMAGASGAKFSLLPPENATGNYVKVVQRIPVRIALDPGQNEDHLLRPGMSVVPTVRLQ
ncbi:MAG TPA: HlyD family secretion protein [Bryobacteraceae bacterium]|nr:HlyD family secretion protein [Bryobacteraceae bacterium]